MERTALGLDEGTRVALWVALFYFIVYICMCPKFDFCRSWDCVEVGFLRREFRCQDSAEVRVIVVTIRNIATNFWQLRALK